MATFPGLWTVNLGTMQEVAGVAVLALFIWLELLNARVRLELIIYVIGSSPVYPLAAAALAVIITARVGLFFSMSL